MTIGRDCDEAISRETGSDRGADSCCDFPQGTRRRYRLVNIPVPLQKRVSTVADLSVGHGGWDLGSWGRARPAGMGPEKEVFP